MKRFKDNALIPKSFIEQDCYTQLFNYIKTVQGGDVKFETSLQLSILGFVANGNCILANAEERSKACWFINQGSVIAYYIDHNELIAVHTIFVAGEIAILPESFMANKNALSFLVACDGAELLKIPAKGLNKNYEHYPSMERLIRLVIAYQYNKPLEKDRILRYKGKQRVLEFCAKFPQINLPGKENKIQKKLIASYLCLAPQSLSRILKSIELDKVKEARDEKG